MVIRLATLADTQAIAKMHQESWHQSFSVTYPIAIQYGRNTLEVRASLWEQVVASQQNTVFVAEKDDQIIGVVEGGKANDKWEQAFDGELHRLYVHPTSQGTGIGKQLIATIAKHLIRDGFQSMLVAAWAVNYPARRFYEKLGARHIRDYANLIEDGKVNNTQSLYVWDDLAQLLASLQ